MRVFINSYMLYDGILILKMRKKRNNKQVAGNNFA